MRSTSRLPSVRDSASELLEQLSDGVTSLTEGRAKATGARRQRAAGVDEEQEPQQSGGVVDAPGKKHRKPAPKDPRACGGGREGVEHRARQGVDEDGEQAARLRR